ncbi:MAG: M24 family metallopeptidase [Bacillota bacterium]
MIDEGRYGEYAGSGMGHGVGLEIHEDPFIRSDNEKVYEAGHVVTIEPGVYVPELGGVRIEDTVVVEENGSRVLPQTSKDLIVL